MFFSAATTILTLHTWHFYDRTSIAGWQSYTVQAGDTLSGLAAKFDAGDYQPTVQQAIEKENHMSGSTIRAGEVLQVPVVGRKLP
jgi:nucleoid-associated protein YgaU